MIPATAVETQAPIALNREIAMKRLVPPLQFGDPEQIEASDYIALVEQAEELLGDSVEFECEYCQGERHIKCACPCGCAAHDIECPECHGKGTTEIDVGDLPAWQLIELIAEEIEASR